MKQFKNLEEAFQHQTSCPFCHEPVKPGWTSMMVKDGEVTVAFQVDDASIDIDYRDNTVKSYEEKDPSYRSSLTGAPIRVRWQHNARDLFKIICICDQCNQYSYTLQVHVRIDENQVVGIFLNSETMSIEEGDTLYEIKNIYATDKTEYNRFTRIEIHDEVVNMSGWSSKRNSTISIPLIPMDLEDPSKTLTRLKTLAIFS